MPDALLDSGSEFDRIKALLGAWLRENVAATTLSPDGLGDYGSEHKFVAGWLVEIDQAGNIHRFKVLIDRGFPYSAIRIAYTSENMYLKWPHVEPGGLLCLPRRQAPSAGIEPAIRRALGDALTLVDTCQDSKFVQEEFQLEFLSYWDRSRHDGAKPVRSLLDATEKAARRIAVWFGQSYTLVGDNADQLRGWLSNIERTGSSPKVAAGVFGYLDSPPFPPFPDTPAELFALLQKQAPHVYELIPGLSIHESVTIVLAASSHSGDGLIAATISPPRNFDGFRKASNHAPVIKCALWRMKSALSRKRVDRFGAAWVHGRGLDKHQPILEAATVLVLGCGSLGSQVAVRLAQSGVGGIVLVDSDHLSAANVGRHALGVNSAGLNKATALANTLSARFPHMRRIEDRPVKWQQLYDGNPGMFGEADLIVACMGDWTADGQLGEWQVEENASRPIVYGWLDEFGTASHALALAGAIPALSCFLDPNGDLHNPVTLWQGGGSAQLEPACGTLFQPYGPIDVAQAEALVSRLCIELLIGKAHIPLHRIHAGPTANLSEAGGTWSDDHLIYRPHGFDGAFEYERPVMPCGQCSACLTQ